MDDDIEYEGYSSDYEPDHIDKIYVNGIETICPMIVYAIFDIVDLYFLQVDPLVFAEWLRNNYWLQYPFTWHVSGEQAFIVHYQELYTNSAVKRWPIPNAPHSRPLYIDGYNNKKRLTDKDISDNIHQTNYHQDEEEEDVCSVCLAEFKTNETLSVLQCNHRYHPNCIYHWLIQNNTCPLCKYPALGTLADTKPKYYFYPSTVSHFATLVKMKYSLRSGA